jgi:hypothetical protein
VNALNEDFSFNLTLGMDLALLAACNHTILTYGTFGFWAGFLAGSGNGKRILPQEKVVFAQKISNISENQRFPFYFIYIGNTK